MCVSVCVCVCILKDIKTQFKIMYLRSILLGQFKKENNFSKMHKALCVCERRNFVKESITNIQMLYRYIYRSKQVVYLTKQKKRKVKIRKKKF